MVAAAAFRLAPRDDVFQLYTELAVVLQKREYEWTARRGVHAKAWADPRNLSHILSGLLAVSPQVALGPVDSLASLLVKEVGRASMPHMVNALHAARALDPAQLADGPWKQLVLQLQFRVQERDELR
jgi:hypothetical protein